MPSQIRLQLTEDMKNAMRARDSVKLTTIRFMISEIKNFEIDNGEQDDAGVQKVIAREVKKIKDAMVDFEKAGRQDLVDEETVKVAIMEAYLPKQMSDEELKAKVEAAISSLPDKNMGAAMKAAMAAVGGQADGGRVSALVKQLLSA